MLNTIPPRLEVVVSKVQIEHLRETLGIGADRPRLSWQVTTESKNWQQAAYEIECCGVDSELPGRTGRFESGESVLVAWPFEPLPSRAQVALRVRVWGTDGGESQWSEPVLAETGLLQAADWSARFVSPPGMRIRRSRTLPPICAASSRCARA